MIFETFERSHSLELSRSTARRGILFLFLITSTLRRVILLYLSLILLLINAYFIVGGATLFLQLYVIIIVRIALVKTRPTRRWFSQINLLTRSYRVIIPIILIHLLGISISTIVFNTTIGSREVLLFFAFLRGGSR